MEQFPRFRKLIIVDLRRPTPIDVEISRIGDVLFVRHKPVVHLLDEVRVVAELADTPFGETHGFVMTFGELLVPGQSKCGIHIKSVPALLCRTFKLEIVNVEADVIDDVIAGIGLIGRRFLSPQAGHQSNLKFGE